MSWDNLGNVSGKLAMIYAGLLVFGLAYNWMTGRAEKNGMIRGYTAIFVVGGVAVTLTGMALISLPYAVLTAGAFIASGTPMIIGSMVRHHQERVEHLKRARQDAHDYAG